jgi:hypothetical protein
MASARVTSSWRQRSISSHKRTPASPLSGDPVGFRTERRFPRTVCNIFHIRRPLPHFVNSEAHPKATQSKGVTQFDSPSMEANTDRSLGKAFAISHGRRNGSDVFTGPESFHISLVPDVIDFCLHRAPVRKRAPILGAARRRAGVPGWAFPPALCQRRIVSTTSPSSQNSSRPESQSPGLFF